MARDVAPLSAPPGVLHTPGSVGQTLNRVGQNVGQAWGNKRENTEKVRFLAAPFAEPEWGSAGHSLPHFNKTRGAASKCSGPSEADRAAELLTGWGGCGSGWTVDVSLAKTRESPDLPERRDLLPVSRRSCVLEKAQPGIRRYRAWSRSREVIAIPWVHSCRDAAAALSMAGLSGPEFPLMMLVCAEQWQHLPAVLRYASACGLEPLATQDALERILWRRARVPQDARAKAMGIRADSYRRQTKKAEALLLDWLHRAASAFANAYKNDQ